jgi:hypothetical protein
MGTGTQTHRQLGDLIFLLTKIKGIYTEAVMRFHNPTKNGRRGHRWMDTDTYRQTARYLISLLSSFQNKKSRLKM